MESSVLSWYLKLMGWRSIEWSKNGDVVVRRCLNLLIGIQRYLLPIFWLGWLLFPSILGLVDYIQYLDVRVLSVMIWSLMAPVEYILGIQYYRSGHLKSIWEDCRRIEMKLPGGGWLVICYVCVGVVMVGVSAILWSVFGMSRLFSIIRGRVGFEGSVVLIGGYWLMSGLVISSNLVSFCLTFRKHLRDMRELKRDMEDRMIWHLDQSSMNELSRRVTNLRYVVNDSISHLENFYTTSTMIGAVAIGPMIEFKVWDAYSLYYLVLYLICQGIFMWIIYQISSLRGNLTQLIRSPSIMSRYLTRIRSHHNVQVLQEQMHHGVSLEELSQMRIAAYCPLRYGDVASSQTGAVDAEMISLEYKMLAGLDWMILYQLLSESWAEFSLVGISFGDTSVIQKGMGITGLIVMVSTYLNTYLESSN